MYKLLDKYSDPSQIREMSLEELTMLSAEIRQFLIESVSMTGGHLAPNLGVVELTIALHNVFDFKKDRVVFDVGHQSYVHKILTGRREGFKNLRKYKGMSGFPKRDESPYDHFNTGHASTSISAALGMARARDIMGEDYSVVCVTGDGALTGGMAWEAMNDIGFNRTRMIIVLNDNGMSISRNVGAMSLYLSQLRSADVYEKLKKDVQKGMEKLPLGKTLFNTARKMKDSVKAMVVEGMIFENMGIKYLGPVDGHSVKDMSRILKAARDSDGPVLVHAITTKGKGYEFAEGKPDKFHGIGPFDTVMGETRGKKTKTYSSVLGETLTELADRDKRVTAVTAAMRDGTGLTGFSLKHPERFFDVGIAEEHAVTMAAGMASSGLKPYVVIYSTFLQRAVDQIIHDTALQKLNVTFCIDRAGLVGDDGETHQGIFDISYLSMIPGMTLMSPKNLSEYKNMLQWSLDYSDGPLAVRYPRGGDNPNVVLPELKAFTPGKWEKVTDGTKTVIISSGKLLTEAYLAKMRLGGICDPAVVNAVFLKPMDKEMIESYISGFDTVITLEDNVLRGGLGEAVTSELSKLGYRGKIINLGYDDTFIEQGDTDILYEEAGLTADKVAEVVKNNCKA